MEEIWFQNAVNGIPTKVAIAKTILKDEALEQFLSGLAERQVAEDQEEGSPVVLSHKYLDNAINAVNLSIFPHHALQIQKLWMRRHMKKPEAMKYRTLQAKVLKMNASLPRFPDASHADKFSKKEVVEILEYAIPQKWRSAFN